MSRKRNTTRLHFTEEERVSPELKKPIQKAEKAADRVEQVKKKARLQFESDAPKPPSKLSHEVKKAPGRLLSEEVHRNIRESEDENVGIQAAHGTEQAAETALHMGESAYHAHKLKPQRELYKEEQKLDQANVDALYKQSIRNDPQSGSNPMSRYRQKQAIKKQYAAAKSGKRTEQTVRGAKKAAQETEKATEKVLQFIGKHKVGFLVFGLLGVLVFLLMNTFSSCSQMAMGTVQSVVGTSYLSEDEDILAVERAYMRMEDELDRRIDSIESGYPGYDEYRYSVDEIGHNPYALISYLTAKYVSFTPAEMQAELETLFQEQYRLNITESIEIRYRTEEQTVTTIDPETGEEITTELVEVPYEYKILSVELQNRGIPTSNLSAEQSEIYAVLMETRGNEPELFDAEDNPFVGSLDITPPTPYEIPPAALADPQFAALIREAEKYLGYPYVWGGSKLSTSFDCNGFTCWVLNQSGAASVGRTNARGLYKRSTVVSRAEAKPGDLIFFTGARAAQIGHPVTHVGIYVGNGMMIHCAGNGVEYHTIDSKYYKKNFYAFGRLGG